MGLTKVNNTIHRLFSNAAVMAWTTNFDKVETPILNEPGKENYQIDNDNNILKTTVSETITKAPEPRKH